VAGNHDPVAPLALGEVQGVVGILDWLLDAVDSRAQAGDANAHRDADLLPLAGFSAQLQRLRLYVPARIRSANTRAKAGVSF